MSAAVKTSAGPAEPLSTARGWLAVASVSVGTFALVTSELMPIGLLPNIAAETGASEGVVGLMIMIPGLVAAIAAPTLIVASGRIDRRVLVWLMGILLVISNFVMAIGASLPVLLAARVLLGIGVGGFWAIGAAAASRLVASPSVGRATALVFAGISGGTVLGVPTGTLLGSMYGWRVAFIAICGLCCLALLAQVLLLPKLPPANAVGMRQFLAFLRVPQAKVGLAAVVFVVIGQFMAYTYVAALLKQSLTASGAMISGALLAYGTAGLLGNTLAGELIQRDLRKTLVGMGMLLGVTITLLPVLGTTAISAMALTVIWGLAFGGVPVCLQSWMFKAAPEIMEGGGALFVSTFQISLAAGALLGGAVVDAYGVVTSMVVGGMAVLTMAALIWTFGKSRYGRSVPSMPI